MIFEEVRQAADQSMEIIEALGRRGPEYKKAWDDFIKKHELPREMPRHGCGVYRPKEI